MVVFNSLSKYFLCILLSWYKASYSTISKQNPDYKCMTFAGGGIYFWHQAGCCKFLQEKCKIWTTNKEFPVIGSSAGALAATLYTSGSDFDKSAKIAIELANKYRIFEKSTGLYGIWGELIREWLDELLPEDVSPNISNQLYITATPFPNIFEGTKLLNGFKTKSEIISACLTSIHIPLFMNNRLSAKYEGQNYIDGSFWNFVKNTSNAPLPEQQVLLKKSSYVKDQIQIEQIKNKFILNDDLLENNKIFVVDSYCDEEFSNLRQGSFVKLINPDGLYEMMEYGYNYMKRRYENGEIPEKFS